MKRAVVVLLLLIANAVVSANKHPQREKPPSIHGANVAQASSLQSPESGKLEACTTL